MVINKIIAAACIRPSPAAVATQLRVAQLRVWTAAQVAQRKYQSELRWE